MDIFNYNNQFFAKHQKAILWIANHRLSRWILGLNRLPKKIRLGHITQVTPASVHFKTGELVYKNGSWVEQYQMLSFCNPRFAESVAYNLSPFVYMKDSFKSKTEWRFSPVGAFGMLFLLFMTKGTAFAFMGTTTTFYSTSDDAGWYYSLNGGTWSQAYNSDGSVNVNFSKTATVWDLATHLNSGHYQIGRLFLPFDTSALGAGATISSSFMTLTSDYYSNVDGETAYLVSVSFTSSTGATQFDRPNWGMTTDYGNRALSAWNPAGTSADITLTSTGRANINKTGTSYFGAVLALDRAGATAPTGVNNVNVRMSEYTGTASDPLLSVTYTASVDITVSPSALSATFSLPASTVTATRSVDVSPSVLSATFSIPAYTVQVAVSVAPSALSATFSIPPYDATVADVTISQGVLTATFTIPSYTVTAIRSVDVSPSLLSATFGIPTYAITTVRHITVSPEVLAMLFSIPTYTARGDFWQEKFSAPATSWSDKISQPSTNWSNKY